MALCQATHGSLAATRNYIRTLHTDPSIHSFNLAPRNHYSPMSRNGTTRKAYAQYDGATTSPPRIVALFKIVFDRRVGYTIAWQRSIPGLKLEGVVEFKSLPSGLHNVDEDQVYFVHKNFAGLSAFKSSTASEAERNASFASVGILVPLSYGRLGRSWLHTDALKSLVSDVLKYPEETQSLEQYWQSYCLDSDSGPNDAENKGRSSSRPGRNRGMSESVTLAKPGRTLANSHPALSIPRFLEEFGPLIFPLYRAALLRQRILLIGRPPVKTVCDYVYILSILASIPQAVSDALSSENISTMRPLFSIGVHDIPLLELKVIDQSSSNAEADVDYPDSPEGKPGWIACTTDEIMSTKTDLYDVKSDLPTASTFWPSLSTSSGVPIKATQRDLRRYRTLCKHLDFLSTKYTATSPVTTTTNTGSSAAGDDPNYERDPLLPVPPASPDRHSEDFITEPSPWAAIAYDAFMWWASAGEQGAELDDENDEDRRLLNVMSSVLGGDRGESPARSGPRKRSSSSFSVGDVGDKGGTVEMAVVAYFHHLTGMMIETLTEVVRSAADTAQDDGTDLVVVVEKEDLVRMGLDVWSTADRQFVAEMVELYFELPAEVRGASVECCGFKIY